MKPTYGMVSRYGLVAFASSLDQIGPLTTTVLDSALVFEAIAGHDPRDSTSLDRPSPRLAAICERDVAGVRVGLLTDLVEGADPEIADAVRRAADSLSAAGAHVSEISVPEVSHALPAYYLIAPAEASSNLSRYDGVRYGLRVDGADVEAMNSATRAVGFGAEVKRRIMLGTFALSSGYYDAYYGQAQRVRTIILRALEGAYQTNDVLLGDHAHDRLRARRKDRAIHSPCTSPTYSRFPRTSPVIPPSVCLSATPLPDCRSASRSSLRRSASPSCSRSPQPWSAPPPRSSSVAVPS